MPFSNAEKFAAVERELSYRRRVYPRQVQAAKMSPQFAETQLKLFEAILEDYRRQITGERLL